MKKAVLTARQADELERVIKSMNHDLQKVMMLHEWKEFSNHKWTEFESLNDLTLAEMESALYIGYEVKNEQSIYEKIYFSKREIEADIDYHVDHLLDAIKTGNEKEIEYNKEKLSELTELLEELK